MANDKKISDLNQTDSPQDGDYLITAQQGIYNKKISFKDLAEAAAKKVQAMFLTGNQSIDGNKVFTSKPKHNSALLLDKKDLPGEAVLLTGNQVVSGVKTFYDSVGVSGSFTTDRILSLENIVGITGSTIMTDGRDPDLFDVNSDDTLVLAFDRGIYITGGSASKANLYVEGAIETTSVSSLENVIGTSGATVMTDGRDPDLFNSPNKSLTMAFEHGAYITGGSASKANLYVEGAIETTSISSLENVIGTSGATVMTDGRGPDLFDGPNKSLIMAFENSVYITGSASSESNLHVMGGVFADTISSLENIVGTSGGTVMTDGRDPDLFDSTDNSLGLAFKGGVVVNKSNLTVGGTGYFTAISPMKSFHSIKYVDSNSAGNIYLPLHAGEAPIKEDGTLKEHDEWGNIILTPYSGRVASILYKAGAYDGTDLGDWTFKVCSTGEGSTIVAGATAAPGPSVIESHATFSPQAFKNHKLNFSKLQHFGTGESLAVAVYRNRSFTQGSEGYVTGNFTIEIDYYPTI
jgi:hypothetical protein